MKAKILTHSTKQQKVLHISKFGGRNLVIFFLKGKVISVYIQKGATNSGSSLKG